MRSCSFRPGRSDRPSPPCDPVSRSSFSSPSMRDWRAARSTPPSPMCGNYRATARRASEAIRHPSCCGRALGAGLRCGGARRSRRAILSTGLDAWRCDHAARARLHLDRCRDCQGRERARSARRRQPNVRHNGRPRHDLARRARPLLAQCARAGEPQSSRSQAEGARGFRAERHLSDAFLLLVSDAEP